MLTKKRNDKSVVVKGKGMVTNIKRKKEVAVVVSIGPNWPRE